MPASPLQKFQQTPAENKKYCFDYTDALDQGETITALAYATEIVGLWPGPTKPAAITAGNGQVESSGVVVFFFVGGGTSDCTYKVSLIVTTSAGQVLEDTIVVQVKAP